MTKQYTWYLLAQELSELDFNKEGLAEVVVAEKTLCVAMHQDKVFACAAIFLDPEKLLSVKLLPS